MACGDSGLNTAQFACKCLNVRIITSEPPSGPPEYRRDENYTPVFVQDDGISVTHPQVTIRVASKPEPIAGSSRHSRFLTVTCLFCNLAVYRVHQTISLEVEGNDSTLLPTEDWVEHEILKTATGWIDVHKDSINGGNIRNAESSSSYVSYFSLVLPSTQSPSPSSEEQSTPVVAKKSPEEPPPTYLSDLPPLFLPPPFTPSHPIFVHLAGIASQQSQELRAASEQRILDFVKAETAGIEMKEMELKNQVEVLWQSFRQNISAVQQERTPLPNLARSPSRGKEGDKFSTNGISSSARLSSSVFVRNFVPEHVSPLVVSGSLPRVSALSASLATSGFHHPRETQRDNVSANGQHGSSPDSSDSLSTSRTGSSTLIHPISRTAGVSIQEYKPNINDDINTQASYRYFVNLEEDMNRYKRTQEEAKQREANRDPQRPGTSKSRSNSSPEEAHPKKSQNEESRSPSGDDTSKAEEETTPSRGRDKGKRKVTFDVEPAVLSTQSDGESTDKGQSDSREMIFLLEDLEGHDKAEDSTNEQQTTLPLFEPSISRSIRSRTSRPNPGLEAFASLRPASLPNPSHIRPMRSQPGVDSSSQSMLISRAAATVRIESTSSRTTSTSSTPRSEYDAAILKLVAADTPSHRGAWTPESKAWQAFIRGKESKENMPPKKTTNTLEEGVGDEAISPKIEGDDSGSNTTTKPRAVQFASKMKVREYDADEEEEDEADYLKFRGIPGSMPINIARPPKKEPLTLASYAVRSTIPEQSAPIASPSLGSAGKPLSAAAIHKAAYAERDRIRARDPGALDFVVQEDDEGEGEDEGAGEADQTTDVPDGDKARKHALRILQARSELPEEGMWRSLA